MMVMMHQEIDYLINAIMDNTGSDNILTVLCCMPVCISQMVVVPCTASNRVQW